MELKDKIDLCLRFHDKVHFFWRWFGVAMIAIVGWSVSEKGLELDDGEKVFISFVVMAYILMNVSGLWYSYQLFFAAREDLFRTEQSEDLESVKAVFDAMKKQRFFPILLGPVYALGVVIRLLFIWRQ
jgi:hypothetical protein